MGEPKKKANMFLSTIYNVFHVSMFEKYVPDPSHVITPQKVQVHEDLSYERDPLKTLIEKSAH